MFLMGKAEHIFGSFKGKNHSKNEDGRLILVSKNYTLYFIFDGVGSASNATEGIRNAKEFIKKNYSKYYSQTNFSLSLLMCDTNTYILDSTIDEAFTTYCAIYIPHTRNDKIKFSNLGDSRIYIITNQFIEQITNDDKLISSRNIITRYLGLDSIKLNDFPEKILESTNCKILLCTDGFYTLMDENKERFFAIFNFSLLEKIKKAIRKEIKQNTDDASYILVDHHV